MKSLSELERRRSAIIEKIDAQRIELAEISQHFKFPLSVVDKGVKVTRFIREHPALASGSVLAFWALRHYGVLGLARKAWRAIYINPTLLSYGSKLISRFGRASKDHHISEVLH